MDNPTWIVVLPPLLVLFFTVLTKRLNTSLLIGIITGALIAAKYDLLNALGLIAKQATLKCTDPDNLYMYGFLLTLGILIVLIEKTGGARAFARSLTKRITNARSAETSSIILSFALFIDDYLSNLTVGTVMRPVTDKFHIPRAKLAYLVHSVSIPLVILTPISSWMAWIITVLGGAGVSAEQLQSTTILADPFYVYLNSIPYIFYSFITLTGLFFIVRWRISFGPMKTHEHIARTTGNVHGYKIHNAAPTKEAGEHDSLIDLIIPIATLVITFIIGILYAGGYALLGGTRTLIETFKHSNQTFMALFIASLISLILGLLLALIRNKIKPSELFAIATEGIQMMLPPVIMLTLATFLAGIMTSELGTGTYIGQLISSSVPAPLMPCILFICSAITATLIGTSWGTIALFIPIALPIIMTFTGADTSTSPEMIPLLYPMLGAIFSGAVCGDNISPISQTTLMAATSAGTDPITHVATQLPYAIPALVSTAIAFLITGILSGIAHWLAIAISLACGIALCVIMLIFMNRKYVFTNQATK